MDSWTFPLNNSGLIMAKKWSYKTARRCDAAFMATRSVPDCGIETKPSGVQ
jgi:hypothetical protein